MKQTEGLLMAVGHYPLSIINPASATNQERLFIQGNQNIQLEMYFKYT